MERGGHTREGLCRYVEQGLDEPAATWMDNKGSAEWGWRVSEERESVRLHVTRYPSNDQSAPVRPLLRAQVGPTSYLRPSEAGDPLSSTWRQDLPVMGSSQLQVLEGYSQVLG